ncbi:type II toxin-antitoxin system VapC family toxin [Hyperthermus butylicus]|uniref:PIN domain-containing protein n=1 Tax=Hyperthermus butylicus (strain DSM 5456 / JCM 9403 / PLM1-5) TaxID=415426 RepID=A2BMG4_HYPBU|nr:type II toxin-antitoxin system VapC family toxin [Hyperthermus butylicus]ABM81175.1 hypothetical protein Hbut_1346 [Hyperthermus butylicus DSM 5456]
MFVVDSSVYASILVRDEYYERARSFIMKHGKYELVTVATAYVEVANTLWKHTYLLRRIPEDSYRELRKAIVPLITASVTRIYEPTELLDEALDAAAEYQITVYDSLFVALALKTGAKLAGFDQKLRETLEAKGLKIVYTP